MQAARCTLWGEECPPVRSFGVPNKLQEKKERGFHHLPNSGASCLLLLLLAQSHSTGPDIWTHRLKCIVLPLRDPISNTRPSLILSLSQGWIEKRKHGRPTYVTAARISPGPTGGAHLVTIAPNVDQVYCRHPSPTCGAFHLTPVTSGLPGQGAGGRSASWLLHPCRVGASAPAAVPF